MPGAPCSFLFLVVRPGAPLVGSLLLVAMSGAPCSFLFLVVRPGGIRVGESCVFYPRMSVPRWCRSSRSGHRSRQLSRHEANHSYSWGWSGTNFPPSSPVFACTYYIFLRYLLPRPSEVSWAVWVSLGSSQPVTGSEFLAKAHANDSSTMELIHHPLGWNPDRAHEELHAYAGVCQLDDHLVPQICSMRPDDMDQTQAMLA